jgi:hypothetical protein
MMTKEEVLALAPAAADEYVAEQVMQWERSARVATTDGGVTIEDCWVETVGAVDVSRRDGSVVRAPDQKLRPVVQTPAFDAADGPQRIIDKMLARGFQFQAQQAGPQVAAAFHLPAATPEQIAAASCAAATTGDAVRRAALFAVQG